MGVREKVALLVIVIVVAGIACTSCMPRSSKKTALKQYYNNLRKTKVNAAPNVSAKKRFEKSSGLPKHDINLEKQNQPINKLFNFPEIEYPQMSNTYQMPTNIFDDEATGIKNSNNIISRNTNDDGLVKYLDNIRKAAKLKRKIGNATNGNASKVDSNNAKSSCDTDPFCFKDIGTFPDVKYPQSISETWMPNFWNYVPFMDKKEIADEFSLPISKKTNNKELVKRLLKPNDQKKRNKSKLAPYYNSLTNQVKTITKNGAENTVTQDIANPVNTTIPYQATELNRCENITENFLSVDCGNGVAESIESEPDKVHRTTDPVQDNDINYLGTTPATETLSTNSPPNSEKINNIESDTSKPLVANAVPVTSIPTSNTTPEPFIKDTPIDTTTLQPPTESDLSSSTEICPFESNIRDIVTTTDEPTYTTYTERPTLVTTSRPYFTFASTPTSVTTCPSTLFTYVEKRAGDYGIETETVTTTTQSHITDTSFEVTIPERNTRTTEPTADPLFVEYSTTARPKLPAFTESFAEGTDIYSTSKDFIEITTPIPSLDNDITTQQYLTSIKAMTDLTVTSITKTPTETYDYSEFDITSQNPTTSTTILPPLVSSYADADIPETSNFVHDNNSVPNTESTTPEILQTFSTNPVPIDQKVTKSPIGTKTTSKTNTVFITTTSPKSIDESSDNQDSVLTFSTSDPFTLSVTTISPTATSTFDNNGKTTDLPNQSLSIFVMENTMTTSAIFPFTDVCLSTFTKELDTMQTKITPSRGVNYLDSDSYLIESTTCPPFQYNTSYPDMYYPNTVKEINIDTIATVPPADNFSIINNESSLTTSSFTTLITQQPSEDSFSDNATQSTFVSTTYYASTSDSVLIDDKPVTNSDSYTTSKTTTTVPLNTRSLTVDMTESFSSIDSTETNLINEITPKPVYNTETAFSPPVTTPSTLFLTDDNQMTDMTTKSELKTVDSTKYLDSTITTPNYQNINPLQTSDDPIEISDTQTLSIPSVTYIPTNDVPLSYTKPTTESTFDSNYDFTDNFETTAALTSTTVSLNNDDAYSNYASALPTTSAANNPTSITTTNVNSIDANNIPVSNEYISEVDSVGDDYPILSNFIESLIDQYFLDMYYDNLSHEPLETKKDGNDIENNDDNLSTQDTNTEPAEDNKSSPLNSDVTITEQTSGTPGSPLSSRISEDDDESSTKLTMIRNTLMKALQFVNFLESF